jgi:hypothetical protein
MPAPFFVGLMLPQRHALVTARNHPADVELGLSLKSFG